MLRTRNFCLRPLLNRDLPALYAFMADAQAMRYTYIAPSPEACAARLNAYEAMRAALGFAPWVVLDPPTDEVIGWGGLSVDPTDPNWGLEVSYAFKPSHWGKGCATELVQYSLAHAFGALAAPAVHAFAMPENRASTRVLEKCGFQFIRYEERLERNHYLLIAKDAV